MSVKDEILEQYQVRKSGKQKTAFIEYVQGICEREGIPFRVEQKNPGSKSGFSARNIVMGDPEGCDMLVTAHYDTCAVLPFPNFITPRNPVAFIVTQGGLSALLILFAALVAGVVLYFTNRLEFAFPIFGLIILLECIQMMCGFANKHTANDNTSGTVAVLDTMLAMTPEQRARTCFVLFDLEELGLIGSAYFARKYSYARMSKPVINLDCISDGDHILVKLSGKDKKSEFGERVRAAFESRITEAGKTPHVVKWAIYPSDQANFKRGFAVAAMRKSWLVGLYMGRIHTTRDRVFEEENIACISKAIIDLAGEQPAAE